MKFTSASVCCFNVLGAEALAIQFDSINDHLAHSFNAMERNGMGWLEEKHGGGGEGGGVAERKREMPSEKGANVCTHLWRKHELNS